jgi:hypothetical protein
MLSVWRFLREEGTLTDFFSPDICLPSTYSIIGEGRCVTVWFHWVAMHQGFASAEKSILWAAIFFLFAVRGGNRDSVDAKIGEQF